MNKSSILLLIYGNYTVLCQLFFLFLLIEYQSVHLNGEILYHRYFSFLEYPLSSVLLLLGGGLVLNLVLPDSK